MNKYALHCVYGAAFAALAAGIILNASSLRRAPEQARRLNRRLAIMAELHDLHRTSLRYEAARQAFEALTNSSPVRLADLAAKTAPGVAREIRELENRPLKHGWTLTRAELVFNEIEL